MLSVNISPSNFLMKCLRQYVNNYTTVANSLERLFLKMLNIIEYVITIYDYAFRKFLIYQ